jgi:hypothetical protein
MIPECNFSYNHYLQVLEEAKSQYNIGPVKDIFKLKKKEKFIILRHDVDVSLEHALRIAELEAKHDLRSTHFILFHGVYYNALSDRNVAIIQKISNFGHEIGLHYDTSFLSGSTRKIIRMIGDEIKILENIIDKKIISIVQHDPSTSPKLGVQISNKFLDPTKSITFKNISYISDSVQNWRRGCMCGHIGNEKQLQILTHPIWWGETHKSRKKILQEFRDEEKRKMDLQIERSQKSHDAYLNINR